MLLNHEKRIIDQVSNLKQRGWVTPELIVLARSRPEEAVLHSCKYVGPECCDSKMTKSAFGAAMVGTKAIDPGIPTIEVGEHAMWCSCIVKKCDANCSGRSNS